MNNPDGPQNNLFQRENENPLEVERSRRMHLKRLGVIICFILIFMDGGSTRQDVKFLHKEDSVSSQNTNSQSLYTSKLNNVINSQRSLVSRRQYPRNVTGVYHGKWQSSSSSSRNTGELQGGSAQTFMMQLRSIKLDNVPDLDFVYGVVKIYKAGIADTDLFYPLQGAQRQQLYSTICHIILSYLIFTI